MKELRRQLEQIGREGGIEIDTDGQSLSFAGMHVDVAESVLYRTRRL